MFDVLKHFFYNKEFALKHFKYLKSTCLLLKYFYVLVTGPLSAEVYELEIDHLHRCKGAFFVETGGVCGVVGLHSISSLTFVEYKRHC